MAIAVDWGVNPQPNKHTYEFIYYAPNIEKVEGAYCFGLVRPSVRPDAF